MYNLCLFGHTDLQIDINIIIYYCVKYTNGGEIFKRTNKLQDLRMYATQIKGITQLFLKMTHDKEQLTTLKFC